MTRGVLGLGFLVLCACYVPNQVYDPVVAKPPKASPPIPLPASVVAVVPTPTGKSGKQRTDHIDPNCDPAQNACMAFLEFDEMGEMWDPDQLTRALSLIDKAKSGPNDPVVVTFTHGWKNNADDRTGRQNGNVIGFEGVLEYLENTLAGFPVVGIYIGWRGDLIPPYWPVRRQFSYFNREGAAIRIPGTAMTSAVTQIMTRTHQNRPNARAIIVGHSFGGLVMERALTPAMTNFVLQMGSGEHQTWADLVVFVNSAAAASEGIQMLDFLKDRHVVYVPDNKDRKDPQAARPLFLSISSLGDTATRFGLPIGHGPSYLSRKIMGSWRQYDPPYPFGVKSQSSFYLSTTAHMDALQSHVIVQDTGGPPCGSLGAVHFSVTLTTGQKYNVCEKPGRLNNTPYWAMEMPVTIVPDHSGIFNENLIRLLAQFLPTRDEMLNPQSHKTLRLMSQ